MKFYANRYYHVYNRGNNKQNVFSETRNYEYFLRKIRRHLLPIAEVAAYCLMPNHFHLLLFTEASRFLSPQAGATGRTALSGPTGFSLLSVDNASQRLSRKIGTILSSYTQGYNKEHQRTGSLFQQHSKSIDVNEQGADDVGLYLSTLIDYIHLNPVRAGLVIQPEQWEFSSAHKPLEGGPKVVTEALASNGYSRVPIAATGRTALSGPTG